MARQTRPWTPAEMAQGPTIWVDAEEQTDVQANGVLTAVSALRGGPMSFSTGNFSDAAVLARGTDGRAWITAPEVAGFEPSGITYPEGSRFASWAYAKGILDGVACRAAEIFAVTRRNSSYTSTSTALMASVGGSSSVGGGALIMRRTPTRVTAQSVQPTASAYQNTDTDGPLLARCYVNEATGLIGTSISGQTPTETSYTPDPSGGSVPSSTAAWFAPRVGDTGYDGAEYLIFYRRLTADEVAQLEGYLAHKWGISDALPDAHPYKSAPPMVDIPEPETVPEVSEAVRYRDWLPKQAPGWLQKPNGRAWLWAHGDMLDSVDDLAHKAVLARFPDYTTEDGLSLIGGERGIARGTDESAADYAARLKDAWTLWQSSGTPAAVLSALRGLGVTNAEIRSEDGRTATLDASGAITYAPPRVTADADERPVRWVTCPDLWHVFQVFIPFEDGPWGEYEMPAADSPEVDALRVAIRRHCGAHAWCDGIVAVNYYGSGLANETPRLVDWPERTIEETWAQDTSEDAWFDQEPSIDNCPRCLWNVTRSDSGPGVTADPE